MKVGFVGLGIMGGAMATNLLKAGFKLSIWNRSVDKCAPLVDLGATVAASPRVVAESSDVVVAMMATPAAVQLVRDGSEGIMWPDCQRVKAMWTCLRSMLTPR